MIVETQIAQFPSLDLDSGDTIAPVEVAYETYGELNRSRTNAILVLHAFSGDAHAAGKSKENGQPGWWDTMIGPGKAFDTDKYFVICSNVVGGCRGTTGPGSINPATGCPYAMSFPPITIGDMVRLQKMLVEHLGIERLLACQRWIHGRDAGAAMGRRLSRRRGRLRFRLPAPPATAPSRSPSMKWDARPSWPTRIGTSGNYYGKRPPARGLAVARMVGHITYMSDRFDARKVRPPAAATRYQFEVESYLRYRGTQFVDRFDANSYLYITKAMDYFDLTEGHRLAGRRLRVR